jgi:5-methylcytosine-specific restriction endonuclease McrA
LTNLEKIEADEAKQQRIQDNNYCCEVCGKRFGASSLQLAHKISASKFNIKEFGRDVMYHHDMMVLTCDKCNDTVLINRASNPIEAMELITSIQQSIITIQTRRINDV